MGFTLFLPRLRGFPFGVFPCFELVPYGWSTRNPGPLGCGTCGEDFRRGDRVHSAGGGRGEVVSDVCTGKGPEKEGRDLVH